jgi:hypothetical protein
MAGEDLTLRMRVLNATRARRDVDQFNRAIRNTGTSADFGAKKLTIFARALIFLQTRAVVIGVLGTGLAALLVVGLPALTLLTAAAIALAGVLLPLAILGGGAMLIFGAQFEQVGTAAYELMTVFTDLKFAFFQAIGPGVNIIFQALADALKLAIPLMKQLTPMLTLVAVHLADGIGVIATHLATLGPEFAHMFALAGPSIALMAESIGPLIEALVYVAIAGIPVLEEILTWVRDFAVWLPSAVRWLDEFAQSAQGQAIIGALIHDVAGAFAFLAKIVADVVSIGYKLFLVLSPILLPLFNAALWVLNAVADALDWVNRNFEIMQWILGPLGGIAIAVGLVAAAFALWNGVLAITATLFAITPFGWVVIAVGALVGAFVVAYQKSETFRNAIDSLWSALKLIGAWMQTEWNIIWDFASVAVGLVADKIQAVVDRIQWALGQVDALTSKADSISPRIANVGGEKHGLLGFGGIHKLPFLADGGNLTSGGSVVVGDRGPEILNLPSGARVSPLESNRLDSGDTVIHNVMKVDGRVLYESIDRHTRRRKSLN